MTVPRFLLILSVLVLTIYVVGLALARRNQGGSADPEGGFIGKLGALVTKRDPVADEELKATNCQLGQDRTIRIEPNVPVATLTIAENLKKKIRQLVLRLPPNTPRQWVIAFRAARSDQDEVRMPSEQILFKGSESWPQDGKRMVPVGPRGGVVTFQRAGLDPSGLVIQLE